MLYVVFGIDVFDGYYCYEYLDFGNLCWVVCEEWFDVMWCGGFDGKVDLVGWDVYVW